ncbi:hypothetical protein ACIBCT_35420 [Streptosporangium sp. NPDC050855]|uniref:hypothetical protein n=1 Tax=Streptosporangium sp. NPDC050855 TaxID=3366194 RepID=UPI003792B3B7
MGAGTSTPGRNVVEMYDSGMSINEWDWWKTNYIKNMERITLGEAKDDEKEFWETAVFYIREDGSKVLSPALRLRARPILKKNFEPGDRVYVCFEELESGQPYVHNGEVLSFEYNLFEGLTRYTLTIFPRESTNDPIPESWNGTLLLSSDSPIRSSQLTRGTWAWIDSHTLDVGVSGDVFVTPYGEDPGVTDAIASRVIAIKERVSA